MDEISLPRFVGLLSLETDVRAFRPFGRLGSDQALSGQVPGDGGPGDGELVGVLQVPSDRVRAGVQSTPGQVFTDRHDQLDHARTDRSW